MKFKQFCQMVLTDIIMYSMGGFAANPGLKERWLFNVQQSKRIDVCGSQLKNQVKYPEICDYGYLSLEFYRSMNSKMKFLILQEVPYLPLFSKRAALENFSFISKYGTVESVLNTIFIQPIILLSSSMKFKLNHNAASVCCSQIVNEIRYPEICDYGYLSEKYHLLRYEILTIIQRHRNEDRYTPDRIANVFLANSIYGAIGLGSFLLSNKYKYNTIITIKEKKRYASIENK